MQGDSIVKLAPGINSPPLLSFSTMVMRLKSIVDYLDIQLYPIILSIESPVLIILHIIPYVGCKLYT